MEYNVKEIGPKIRTLRKRRNITQEKLSELSGISTQHLCRIENTVRNPSLETIYRIAYALETTPEILLGIEKDIYINYEDELKTIFEDCNEYERTVIGEMLVDIKRSIRKNISLLGKEK